jgi:hypothetical protein
LDNANIKPNTPTFFSLSLLMCLPLSRIQRIARQTDQQR